MVELRKGEIVKPWSTICLTALVSAFRIAWRKDCLSLQYTHTTKCDAQDFLHVNIDVLYLVRNCQTFEKQDLEVQIFQVAIVWFCPWHQLPAPR